MLAPPSPAPSPRSVGELTFGTETLEAPRPDPTPVDPVPEIARAGGVRTAIALLVTDGGAGRRPRDEALRQALELATRGGLDQDAEELARRLIQIDKDGDAGRDPVVDRHLPWIVERLADRSGRTAGMAFLDQLVKAGYESEPAITVCRALVTEPGEVDTTGTAEPWDVILGCTRSVTASCPELDEMVAKRPDDIMLRMFHLRRLARTIPPGELQPLLADLLARSPESILFVKKLQLASVRREQRLDEAARLALEIQQLEGLETARSW